MSIGTNDNVRVGIGGDEAYLALFDRDGDGVVEDGADSLLAMAKAYADSAVYGILGASHPGLDFDTPGSEPPEILESWVELVIAHAGRRFPGTGPNGSTPYDHMDKRAVARLKAISEGDDWQLPSGPAAPFAGGAAAYVSAPAAVWNQASAQPADSAGQVLTSNGSFWQGNGGGGRSGF